MCCSSTLEKPTSHSLRNFSFSHFNLYIILDIYSDGSLYKLDMNVFCCWFVCFFKLLLHYNTMVRNKVILKSLDLSQQFEAFVFFLWCVQYSLFFEFCFVLHQLLKKYWVGLVVSNGFYYIFKDNVLRMVRQEDMTGQTGFKLHNGIKRNCRVG